MAAYKTLAIVDDVNTCDCCGKQNLKSTVAMERDNGEILHFGSICATRHSGRDAKSIKSEAAAEIDRKQLEARAEFNKSLEELAYRVKLAEAARTGIRPGKAFAEFCHVAGAAADAKRAELANKFGIPTYLI